MKIRSRQKNKKEAEGQMKSTWYFGHNLKETNIIEGFVTWIMKVINNIQIKRTCVTHGLRNINDQAGSKGSIYETAA